MFYKKTVLAHGPRRSIVGGSAVTTGAAAAGQLPLSHVVQAMRSTRQTAEYIAQMGPFFVGHARWQSKGA